MKCPCCGEEMEKGVVQTRDPILWNPKRRAVVSRLLHPDSVAVSPYGWGLSSTVDAYLCRSCKKVVIDYSEVTDGYLEEEKP